MSLALFVKLWSLTRVSDGWPLSVGLVMAVLGLLTSEVMGT